MANSKSKQKRKRMVRHIKLKTRFKNRKKDLKQSDASKLRS